MEEAYWKQFMVTGKVEDYLQFRQVSQIEKIRQPQEETKANGETTERNWRQSEREFFK